MSWQGLEGHDGIVEYFRRAIARGRLAHAYLFVGPTGVGKRRFALLLAKSLYCRQRPAELLDPCNRCQSCCLVEAGTHPDLLLVAKPEDKSEFPVELLVGEREGRGEPGACRALAFKPTFGDRRILILDDADYLNPESANALLKTLEEPPPGAVIFLLATSAARQLPTIRSRCQIVRFRPLTAEVVAGKLLELGYVDSPDEAERVAQLSGGSIGRAIELLELQALEMRKAVEEGLLSLPGQLPQTLERLGEFVEKGGSSAQAKERLRVLLQWAAEIMCGWLRILTVPPGLAVRTTVEYDSTDWLGCFHDRGRKMPSEDRLLEAIEITLAAADLIDRNVQRAALLQAWLQKVADLVDKNN